MITWVKYRTRWSWGKGKWDYASLGEPKTKEDFENAIESLAEDVGNPVSEQYRGMEYVKIKAPSKEYLQEQIERKEKSLGYIKQEIEELKVLLKKVKSKKKL